jgi:hypothetical protein
LYGGEGRASRDAFEASSADDKKALVTFLKTLQVVSAILIDSVTIMELALLGRLFNFDI